jgi:tRNA(Arg) A34 adenosine deaminase TadA
MTDNGEERADQSEVVQAVRAYLERTRSAFQEGQDAYYARGALQQAMIAHLEGNYGIGAVAVVVGETDVAEYPARNAMVTGEGILDHAETRAVLAVRRGDSFSSVTPRAASRYTQAMERGVTVFGTIEPCPMCVAVMTNGGVRRSVSTVQDGDLVTVDGLTSSDGGSTVLGEKWRSQPWYWRDLQERVGIRFELAEVDPELRELSAALFLRTAAGTTERLANRWSP